MIENYIGRTNKVLDEEIYGKVNHISYNYLISYVLHQKCITGTDQYIVLRIFENIDKELETEQDIINLESVIIKRHEGIPGVEIKSINILSFNKLRK